MKTITRDWFVGFVEGEGCWTWAAKHNNTTRRGKRVLYRRPQPQFLLAQKGREILDRIALFIREKTGATVRVWAKRKSGRGQDGAADGSGNHELRVLGYLNCRVLFPLFDGAIRSEKKRRQYEAWRARILSQRSPGRVPDADLI